MRYLWWSFGVLMVTLILRVRFYHEPDEYCEYCYKEIDTERDGYLTSDYAVELGVTRVYDEWFFCSTECATAHTETLENRTHD